MINYGKFTAHSGNELTFKLECDDLTDADIDGLAQLISDKIPFGEVIGVPTGGIRLATALFKYRTDSEITLVVDDVLTTGKSMNEYWCENSVGIVLFARGDCPEWITPVFTLNKLFR